MNAASYGCKTYKVTNEEELRFALEDAKKQIVSTLIDVKVLQKPWYMVMAVGGMWGWRKFLKKKRFVKPMKIQ